jgi:ABC-type phosphonate transport system ATPase subunit
LCWLGGGAGQRLDAENIARLVDVMYDRNRLDDFRHDWGRVGRLAPLDGLRRHVSMSISVSVLMHMSLFPSLWSIIIFSPLKE